MTSQPIDSFASLVQSRNFTVKVRLETAGRKGKSVTVLDGLPKSEIFLKELLKTLKQTCGAGGTYSTEKKDGIVEIQGDHRDRVCALLEKHQMKFSRS